MKDMRVTQEYIMCAVNEKGKVPTFATERFVCLVASGLLELRLENCISIDRNVVKITNELPDTLQYLTSLYEYIKMKKEIKINELAGEYIMGFGSKKITQLMDDIMDSLHKASMLEETKAGFMHNKISYCPKRDAITIIIDKIRSEIMEDGNISDEVAILTLVLDRSNLLKTYFSKFEQKELKQQLAKFLDLPEGKIIKDMVAYIELLVVVVASL